MSGITLTKGEFDAFWSEVLGPSWFIDDWDANDDALNQASAEFTITITVLDRGWQGSGDPQFNEYLTARDLETTDTLPVLRRWLAGRAMRHVSAWIPQAAVAEFEQFLSRVGGQPG